MNRRTRASWEMVFVEPSTVCSPLSTGPPRASGWGRGARTNRRIVVITWNRTCSWQLESTPRSESEIASVLSLRERNAVARNATHDRQLRLGHIYVGCPRAACSLGLFTDRDAIAAKVLAELGSCHDATSTDTRSRMSVCIGGSGHDATATGVAWRLAESPDNPFQGVESLTVAWSRSPSLASAGDSRQPTPDSGEWPLGGHLAVGEGAGHRNGLRSASPSVRKLCSTRQGVQLSEARVRRHLRRL